jgi:signal transduction histidine kinase
MSNGIQRGPNEATLGETTDRAASLRHLHGATRRMLGAESTGDIAAVATDAAGDILGFDLNSVRLVEPAPPRLVSVAYAVGGAADGDGAAAIGAGAESRRDYTRGESVQWDAIDDGEVHVYQDVSAIDDDIHRPGDGSMLVCPLGDRGVLSLGTREVGAIDDEDIALAQVLAANTEAALERAERERRLERKTERLNRFAGVVAHEFRNPLAIASGHLDQVGGGPTDEPNLSATRRAVGQMDRLIDSLLDVVRGGEPTAETEVVSVAEVAREVYEADVTTTAALRCPDAVTVEADRDRLRTILENLLGNAVAHSGPEITVTVGALEDRAGFYVADDGPGFDATDPERLFEYGATADAEATGLGLAIVRDIAEAHGWRVTAALADGGGARIEFHTRPTLRGDRNRVGDGRPVG